MFGSTRATCTVCTYCNQAPTKCPVQVCICTLSYLCPDGSVHRVHILHPKCPGAHPQPIADCKYAPHTLVTLWAERAQDMFSSTRAVCIVCTYCNQEAHTKCPGAHPQPIADCKYAPHKLLTSKRFSITPLMVPSDVFGWVPAR